MTVYHDVDRDKYVTTAELRRQFDSMDADEREEACDDPDVTFDDWLASLYLGCGGCLVDVRDDELVHALTCRDALHDLLVAFDDGVPLDGSVATEIEAVLAHYGVKDV